MRDIVEIRICGSIVIKSIASNVFFNGMFRQLPNLAKGVLQKEIITISILNKCLELRKAANKSSSVSGPTMPLRPYISELFLS